MPIKTTYFIKTQLFLFLLIIIISQANAASYSNCSTVPSPVLNEGGITRTCREVTSCGTLTYSNSYYLLMNDLTSNFSCLVLRATDNSVINLNNYTITFNNLPLNLLNGGFEEEFSGDATKPAYWDLTNAPDIERIYDNTNFLFGNYYMRINNNSASSPNYITSNLINIPVSGQTYMAWTIPRGLSRAYSIVFIEVLDEFGNSLCRAESASLDRAQSISCRFKPTSSTNVFVRVGSPVNNATISFDFVGLASAFDYGIISRPYCDAIYRAPDDCDVSRSNNVIVTNGRINQGIGSGPYNHAIMLVGGINTKVNNLYSNVNGINANNVLITGDGTEISYSNFTSSSPYGLNRMVISPADERANIQVTGSGNNYFVHDNSITGGPQRLLSVAGTNISFYNNYLSNNATLANNHMIGIRDGAYNISVYNNTIYSANGRGMTIEGIADNVRIYNNYIDVMEFPQREYYQQYSVACATGIKLENPRNGASSIVNINIFNNTLISRSGPGTWGGCPFMAGFETVGQEGEGVFIHDNNISAIYGAGSESSSWATALSYYAIPNKIQVYHNLINSNHRLVSMQGVLNGPTITSNTFSRIGPDIVSFSSIYNQYVAMVAIYDNLNTYFLNNTFIVGSVDNINMDGLVHNWNYTVGWFLDTTVQTNIGVKLSGANVVIKDKNNVVVYSGTTDATGHIQNVLTEYLMSGYSTTINPKIYSSPYTISVTYNTETQTNTTNLQKSENLVFTFGGSSCIDGTQLSQSINDWKQGSMSIVQIISIIKQWKLGC